MWGTKYVFFLFKLWQKRPLSQDHKIYSVINSVLTFRMKGFLEKLLDKNIINEVDIIDLHKFSVTMAQYGCAEFPIYRNNTLPLGLQLPASHVIIDGQSFGNKSESSNLPWKILFLFFFSFFKKPIFLSQWPFFLFVRKTFLGDRIFPIICFACGGLTKIWENLSRRPYFYRKCFRLRRAGVTFGNSFFHSKSCLTPWSKIASPWN